MKVDKKIEKVKVALKEFGAETLSKIVTRKKEEHTIFYRSSELKKWLDENSTYFTDIELKLLGYECNLNNVEITTESEVNSDLEEKKGSGKTQEITNVKNKNSELELQVDTNVILNDLLSEDEIKKKFVYFLSNIDEFLGIKKQMDKNLVIPSDLLKNESVGVTVRLWKSTLEEFNKFCEEHKNYTKIQLMSYALTEFMEKYK